MSKNYGNDSQIAEIVKYISDTMKFPIMGAGGGFAPIGTINFFDASIAPQGWLACDGQTYNITDYPDLATFYASVHGASNFYGGNGTTTFAVPDLRGEFLRGTGTNSHENQGSGANVGVHQDGTEHVNIGAFKSDKQYIQVNRSGGVNDAENVSNPDYIKSRSSVSFVTPTASAGVLANYGLYTSRPTNTSFLICVKATVSGDPNAHVYSTDEQVVGTWIDGTPVYEKTINFGALPNNSTKSVAHGIDNLDFVVSVNMFSSNNAYVLPIPYVATDNISNGRELWLDKTNISVRTAKDSSSYVKTYVTIQYTKSS